MKSNELEAALSRRKFLHALGVAPIAAGILGQAGCSDNASSLNDNEASEDAILADPICRATGDDLEGPFFRPGAPRRMALAAPGEPGTPLLIRGVVRGPDCKTPLRNVLLDIWQADARGRYDNESTDFRLRGQITTNLLGEYSFTSVIPGNYLNGDAYRPAHIHFTLTRPGYRTLTTQLYFEGDPYLAPNDSCGSCNSDDSSHIIKLGPLETDGGLWQAGQFDIVLVRG
jgi:catechol 1,2-dioxygenase